MSSYLLDIHSCVLLECRMDFRDNWIRALRTVVAERAEQLDGDSVAARKTIAAEIEMNEQTLYQYLEGKSGKAYPSSKIMLKIEKKYSYGRPPGWTCVDPTTRAIANNAHDRWPDAQRVEKLPPDLRGYFQRKMLDVLAECEHLANGRTGT